VLLPVWLCMRQYSYINPLLASDANLAPIQDELEGREANQGRANERGSAFRVAGCDQGVETCPFASMMMNFWRKLRRIHASTEWPRWICWEVGIHQKHEPDFANLGEAVHPGPGRNTPAIVKADSRLLIGRAAGEARSSGGRH